MPHIGIIWIVISDDLSVESTYIQYRIKLIKIESVKVSLINHKHMKTIKTNAIRINKKQISEILIRILIFFIIINIDVRYFRDVLVYI